MTISTTAGIGLNEKAKGNYIMNFISFILDHVGKILGWTHDPEEAAIIREIAAHFPMLID